MAIDFFVMPLSRYLTGAFITPTMQLAWSQGLPYSLRGQAARDIPPGEPFGGPEAMARRRALLSSGMVQDDLRKYPPAVANALWDEASEAEPRFHRVDPTSYNALLEERAAPSEGRRLFGLLKKKPTPRSHLTAKLFLPAAFDEPFETKEIFIGWLAGSVASALSELARGPGSPATASARETLAAALRDAAELQLPMIVDW